MRRLITLKLFLALVIIAGLAVSTSAYAGLSTGGGSWEWVRPDVQGNRVNSMDFVNADTGWSVGHGGLIMKTTDGGATWFSQSPGVGCSGSSGGCNINGVDFVDANTGWAVGDKGTAWKTTDGGATWTPQTIPLVAGNPPTLLAVSFVNASVGVATGEYYAFYTVNGGGTWTRGTVKTDGVNTFPSLSSVQMVSSTVGYAVGNEQPVGGLTGVIYKTVNGGVAWTRVTTNVPTTVSLNGLYFKDANNGFLVGQVGAASGTLLKTADGGATWEKNTIQTISSELKNIAVSGNNIVMVGANGTILRRNNASNWTDTPDTIVAGLITAPSNTTNALHTVKFASASSVFTGGVTGFISKSADGGASWNKQAGGDTDSDILSTTFVSKDVGWAGGVDGLVVRTDDAGETWTSDASGIPADVRVKGLHFLNETTGFAVGCQGENCSTGSGVAYKYNAGSWSAMTLPEGTAALRSVHMIDSSNGWAVGANGTALRTSDGSNWILTNTGLDASVQISSVDAVADTSTAWAAAQIDTEGKILKFSGGVWSIHSTVAPWLTAVDMIDASTGYIVGVGGRIYKTTDGGTIWVRKGEGVTNKDFNSVSFLGDGLTGFAAGGSALVDSMMLKTTDGGENWSAEQVGAGIKFNTVSALSPGAGQPYSVYAGGDSGMILRYLTPKPYHFTWYDNANAQNWVLMANPSSGAGGINFSLSIAGVSKSLASFKNGLVMPGQSIAPQYPGVQDGPVRATSVSGKPAIVSQRILWGASSIEEVTGTDEDRLSSHFWWTWYDQSTPGMSNWVMVANPGGTAIDYVIKIDGANPGAGSVGTVPAGDTTYVAFPGVIGGPVELEAFVSGTGTPAEVIASQRVLSGGGQAFNEMPGIPDEELSDHYLWTWYDSVGSGGNNWVMLANPNQTTVYYEITLEGADPGTGSVGSIAPGEYTFQVFPGKTGGPMEVRAYNEEAQLTPAEVVASQRIVWGPSFGETPGYRFEALSPSYHWTWYDQLSSGSLNWVMVSNPTGQQVYYEITVAGANPGEGSTGTLEPGESASPSFPTKRGGPVEVNAWTNSSRTTPANVLSSQRVLWNGYFNEVLGTVLD